MEKLGSFPIFQGESISHYGFPQWAVSVGKSCSKTQIFHWFAMGKTFVYSSEKSKIHSLTGNNNYLIQFLTLLILFQQNHFGEQFFDNVDCSDCQET